jgi:IS1 family transposase
MDAETKLGVSLVIGPRSQANAEALWSDFAQRTDHALPALITTDEYRVYAGALLRTYGLPQPVPPTGKPGRPCKPRVHPPRALVYAMVHKLRRKGRVVKVTIQRVFGTARQLAQALARSTVSAHVNTSFVERFNATVRQHNSRKARKVYTFSKDFAQHVAMSWFALSYYNFCRSHLGLRLQEDGAWRARTPAMAAGLSDHVWSIREFMDYPLIHQSLVSVPDQ